MSEKKSQASGKASGHQAEKKPQTEVVATSQPSKNQKSQPEEKSTILATGLENYETQVVTTSQPSKNQKSQPEEKSAILATGLEDYGRWKAMFKDHNQENDPPFRRGRIWA